MKKKHPILFKKIEKLATSDEFLLMARKNNFKNLHDICEIHINELMKKPGMNYRILTELGEILNGYGLIHLIKEN